MEKDSNKSLKGFALISTWGSVFEKSSQIWSLSSGVHVTWKRILFRAKQVGGNEFIHTEKN